MIKSFKDKATHQVFQGFSPKGFPTQIVERGRIKLLSLNAATSLNDLRAIPGNYLEALKKDRKGQHSIRINDQYRVCFVWTAAGPEKVEITDYH